MPTYQYNCEKCGHQFDKFQPISASALETCPEDVCPRKKWGHGKVKRVIGAGAGLIFKGSGFYITDYRSENYKAGSKKEAGGDTKPATTPAAPAGGAKTETKAAPAPSAPKDK
jgi:putative FmdB family regulatory protein